MPLPHWPVLHVGGQVWGEDVMEFKPDRWLNPTSELGKKAIKARRHGLLLLL